VAKVLPKEEALKSGADLWILPSFRFSEWTKRLDWPLNLQVTKSLTHRVKPLSSRLQEIMAEHEIATPKTTSGGPLLIASSDLLPNRWTVILESDQIEAWQKGALEIWKNLGEPSVRVFAPTFLDWRSAKGKWPGGDDLQVVESSGGH
jgi:hypothetical protein